MAKIKYWGHACFTLEKNGKVVLIDPFISGNPSAPHLDTLPIPDLILVSHGHQDHLGDAILISKKNHIPILAVFELANYCESKGAKVIAAHMGSKINFDFGWVMMTQAQHSSSTPEGNYAGVPVGFLINFYGKIFYHAGDTALFNDMKILGENYFIDLAMLPIGGYFTMGIDEAVQAVNLLNPKIVIPMHYGTFDVIKQDPEKFLEKAQKEAHCKCIILQTGSEYETSNLISSAKI
ncbi:MAG: metal-dependent hydrolase [Armatimonadetes bacterium]|nr:metal-dependent hydrolase [Armatimonadota bacterium]